MHKDRCRGKPRSRWLFPIVGAVSLAWFLVRVIPKPSRAAYPCQRAAAPLASGFVVWLLSMAGAAAAYRKAGSYRGRAAFPKAGACAVVLIAACLVATSELPRRASGQYTASHGPIGTAMGIHPGRVVWVWNPGATDWDGYSSPEHWYDDDHTDPLIVERMVSQAIRGVAGRDTDEDAWDRIFRYFNVNHGRGDRGYQSGEKIMIKINLTTCFQMDKTTYNKYSSVLNQIDHSPQMLLALLKQLVFVVGVNQSDITIGDPGRPFANHVYLPVHAQYPNVHYLDSYGGSGRMRSEFSSVPFNWSPAAADGKTQDYLPVSYAEMDYFINFAILKGHTSGVTLCGKNNYGSLIRNPDGGLPNGGRLDYYDMHLSRPEPQWSPGMGHYRAIVDLMGHPQLGGKTLLYLIDGLYAGYFWDAHPYEWNSTPFNGDWPSSVFASQDPVAIDSVTYDFLLAEWPNVVTGGDGAPGSLQGGAEDYLHEAAQADNPPSGMFYDPDKDGQRMTSLGVHEHWDDAVHKRYSRNLGAGSGIELIQVTYDNGAIGRAKLLSDNATAIVAGAVVTAASDDFFYIEADDRSNGIRVERSGHGLSPGVRVNLTGILSTTSDGERRIEAFGVGNAGTGTIGPLVMANRNIGGGDWMCDQSKGQKGVRDFIEYRNWRLMYSPTLNNIGLLVTTFGHVTYSTTGYFYLDDGAELQDISGHIGIKVLGTVPIGQGENPIGRFVKVTGISSCFKAPAPDTDLYRLIRATQIALM